MKTFLTLLAGLLLCAPALVAQIPPPKDENSLRVVSYNTHNCIGMDDVTSYDRVADVISSCAPDVVALQELDSMTMRSRTDVLGELASRTMMHPTFGAAIEYGGGKYGIGILSREKPLGVRRIPLPGSEEPRVLLIAEFERYVVCCTHLSLTAEDRLASARIIIDAVGEVEKPLFLAGDMNDENDSDMQRLLGGRFTVLNDPGQPTFGTGKRAECIDFIYGMNNRTLYSLSGRGVVPEEVASDHRPLWVDVKLAAEESR